MKNNTELPALVVNSSMPAGLKQAKVGLSGFGYDFDNMKARCWYDHHLQLLLDKKKVRYRSCGWLREQLHGFSSLLRSALKEASLSNPKVQGVILVLWIWTSWNKTRRRFLRLVRRLKKVRMRIELLANGIRKFGYSHVGF
ncbi:type I-E CRISPR-associated protein Cse1/CasA [Escherichia coli]